MNLYKYVNSKIVFLNYKQEYICPLQSLFDTKISFKKQFNYYRNFMEKETNERFNPISFDIKICLRVAEK